VEEESMKYGREESVKEIKKRTQKSKIFISLPYI
jgi:hypothetical protein